MAALAKKKKKKAAFQKKKKRVAIRREKIPFTLDQALEVQKQHFTQKQPGEYLWGRFVSLQITLRYKYL